MEEPIVSGVDCPTVEHGLYTMAGDLLIVVQSFMIDTSLIRIYDRHGDRVF